MSCPCSRPCQGAPDNTPLMRHGDVFRFERGDRLWGQGDAADSVIAICTGAVKTVREWPKHPVGWKKAVRTWHARHE